MTVHKQLGDLRPGDVILVGGGLMRLRVHEINDHGQLCLVNELTGTPYSVRTLTDAAHERGLEVLAR